MEKCPHGHNRPMTAASNAVFYMDRMDRPKMEVIHDSSECPHCLQGQVHRANQLVNLLGETQGGPNHPFNNPDNLQLWLSYIRDYNP